MDIGSVGRLHDLIVDWVIELVMGKGVIRFLTSQDTLWARRTPQDTDTCPSTSLLPQLRTWVIAMATLGGSEDTVQCCPLGLC